MADKPAVMQDESGVHLHCYSVLERHADIAVGVERFEGAQFRILQQQHGFGTQTDRYHRDDVGMFQLT